MATKENPFNMRISDNMYNLVKDLAEKNDMSMADYFRQAVMEKIKREEKEYDKDNSKKED